MTDPGPGLGLVLGLDGGGTKTVAVLVDSSGTVVARRDEGGLDPTAGTGWEERLHHLAVCLGTVEAAALGLPYHDEIPGVSARQDALARELFGPRSIAVNDVAVAFEGAFAGDDGVLVLAGTGSMAWARGPGGTYRVGGWGDVFGDEGSAHWIGREALGVVSRHLDGRRPALAFAEALLAGMGVAPGGLIAWAYEGPGQRAAVAGVAALVSTLAEAGDPKARALMARAGGHLADLGLTAARLSGGAAPWSVAGGAMADPTLRGALERAMGSAPACPRLPPVGGAVLLAARAAGWTTGEAFARRLALSLEPAPASPMPSPMAVANR